MTQANFPRRFGKYYLIDRVASGGMAEVYRAKVTGVESFEREIAIKCIRPELLLNEQFATMFVDEANLAGQLQHANIAQTYELGRYKNQLYIAMELVEGHDLRAIIKRVYARNLEFGLGFAAYVAAKAAEGLDHAHRKKGKDGLPMNLVHRDISPQNILVSFEGEVKLVDFGIAKATTRVSETTTGFLKGKFSYMAPEQVRGNFADRRTDIFALGACLFEMCTGNKLFEGQTDLEIIEKVRTCRIPDLGATLPEAPPELIAVLKNALAEDADKRYQWASDMVKGLQALLIKDRSIFGAREASEVMAELYKGEIEELGARGNYDLDDLEEESSVRSQEVFGSAFENKPDDSDVHEEEGFWARPTMQLGGPELEKYRNQPPGEVLRPATEEVPTGQDVEEYEDEDAFAEDSEEREALWKTPTDQRSFSRARTDELLDDRDEPRRESRRDSRRASEDYTRGGGPPWLLIALGGLGLAVGVGLVLFLGGDDAQDAKKPAGLSQPHPGKAAKAKPATDFGYVTVKVQRSKSGVIYIDGKQVGKAPGGTYKVKPGSHTIKVIERRRGKIKKARSQKVTIGDRHTKKSPAKVTIKL